MIDVKKHREVPSKQHCPALSGEAKLKTTPEFGDLRDHNFGQIYTFPFSIKTDSLEPRHYPCRSPTEEGIEVPGVVGVLKDGGSEEEGSEVENNMFDL